MHHLWSPQRSLRSHRPHPHPPRPITIRLLRLYPAAWRQHYGEELSDLLAEEPVSVPAILYVLAGALDAHLHAQLVPAAVSSHYEQVRSALLTVFCAFVAFLVTVLGGLEAVHDGAFAPVLLTRVDPQPTWLWKVLTLGAVPAVLAALGGGTPILVSVVKETYTTRRHDLWLLAIPPLTALVLGACDGVEELRRSRPIALPAALGGGLDLLFHALFVLAAVVCAATVCTLVARSTAIRFRIFQIALSAAAALTTAMATILGATIIWLLQARANIPQHLDPSPLAVVGVTLLLAVMALSTVVAVRAVAQGFAARTSGPGAAISQ